MIEYLWRGSDFLIHLPTKGIPSKLFMVEETE